MTNLCPEPSNGIMWRAYAVAPIATPVAFIVLLSFVGVVLPLPAIAAVTVTCYVVAGLIGMPIAFLLRRLDALNAFTIHGAAFCWGVLSSIACTAVVISVGAAIGGTWNERQLITLHFSVIVPPVVLSGTAFWFLLRRMAAKEYGAGSSNDPSVTFRNSADQAHMHLSCGPAGY